MQVYTTANVDDHRRLTYWNTVSTRAITPMRITPDRRHPFEGRLWVDRMGPIDLARAYSTGVVIRRAVDLGSRSQQRAFMVTVSESSSYTVRVKDREHVVRGGDLQLSHSRDLIEEVHAGCTVVVLRVPEEIFRAYLPVADELVGKTVSGERGAGLHASTMIRSLPAGMRCGFAARAADHLSAALLHSIAAAYSEAYGLDARPVTVTADSRRLAIKRFVEANLSDADLTVQNVAAEFGLTDRYLRMLFETERESLGAYIQRRRLEESARQLRDSLSDTRTISEIAFACGFNSLGSYDRAFKTTFGTTPGQYRRRFREGAARPATGLDAPA